jgi:hypothetical protein
MTKIIYVQPWRGYVIHAMLIYAVKRHDVNNPRQQPGVQEAHNISPVLKGRYVALPTCHAPLELSGSGG